MQGLFLVLIQELPGFKYRVLTVAHMVYVFHRGSARPHVGASRPPAKEPVKVPQEALKRDLPTPAPRTPDDGLIKCRPLAENSRFRTPHAASDLQPSLKIPNTIQ